ncbi:lambda exonuclease family protein [Oceanicaulis sp.]|uniref:lambda exonuclease family protein n=1 Tax=Oceanicaulis sp. TaxID=1924941 RepID=UPI003D2B0C15
MSVQIHDMDQGTPEWFAIRAGRPTASEFSTIMASGRGGAPSKTRRTLMLKLAGEILTGEPAESYSNAAMERGHEMEAEARNLYAFMADVEPVQVGFVTNKRPGCSPDALVGERGGLEIKTRAPHLMIDTLLKGEMPPEHMAQVQGCMWVCEREWWDFAAYYRGLPLFTKRIERDEAYIARMASAVAEFTEELDEVVASIRARMGESEAA